MNGRYHALDSMRATMMLLGIYLHVVVGYSGNGQCAVKTSKFLIEFMQIPETPPINPVQGNRIV